MGTILFSIRAGSAVLLLRQIFMVITVKYLAVGELKI